MKTFPTSTLLDALHAARWRVVGELADVSANPDPYVVQGFAFNEWRDAEETRNKIKTALCKRLDVIDYEIAGLMLTAGAADVLNSMGAA